MGELTKTFLLASTGGLAGALLTVGFQLFMEWYRRPKLVLACYEHQPPMYRQALNVQTGEAMYWVNVGVQNRGHSVAERCRAVVTAIAELKENIWVQEKNWLPLDLMWAGGVKEVEVDLIPEPARRARKSNSPVVYYFNTAFIKDDGINQLHLAVMRRPTAQTTSFPPGSYAVQIIVYSVNGDWAGRWYKLVLNAGTDPFCGNCLTVCELDDVPVVRRGIC